MVDEKCVWGQKINYSKVWGSGCNYDVKENKKEIKNQTRLKLLPRHFFWSLLSLSPIFSPCAEETKQKREKKGKREEGEREQSFKTSKPKLW